MSTDSGMPKVQRASLILNQYRDLVPDIRVIRLEVIVGKQF